MKVFGEKLQKKYIDKYKNPIYNIFAEENMD